MRVVLFVLFDYTVIHFLTAKSLQMWLRRLYWKLRDTVGSSVLSLRVISGT